MEAKIIRDSQEFVIAFKPAGMLAIAGRGELSQEITLLDILEEKYGKLFIVHRLDRDVSGAILFAKNAQAHRYYSNLFETRNIEKAYLALVYGKMCGAGEINKPLAQRGSGRVSVAFDGKPSITKWRVLRNYGALWTLLEVNIVTGRRHQIRVHLYSEGHPIAGDVLYGDISKQKKFPRILLHSWRIKFKDMAGKQICAEAYPPEDFISALDII